MICWKMRRKLPGYLDGALLSADQTQLRNHLGTCAGCRTKLESYREMGAVMSRVDRAEPPADLAVRIRVRVSEARNAESWLQRVWSRAVLVFQNILEPLAVPAGGGALTATLAFLLILQNLLAGVPLGAVPNDLPTNLLQPARLESLAQFPLLDGEESPLAARHLVVEVTLNARGQMVDYQILAGPDGAHLRRHLDQVLMFSRFRPQMSFGRPIPGGRVILNFSEVRVQG
ncbi:MAG: zf-HC2 domain-containing protein [Terriglobales bacterium]